MRKRFFLFFTLVAWTAPSFAYFLLDDVMGKSIQKRTGVVNLNHNQKLALEQWMNDTFLLKNPPKETRDQDLYITQNIDNGRKLRLNDNSLWEVSPSDIAIAELWLTASPLNIEPSEDPNYPCMLINIYTGVGIRCKNLEAGNIIK